MDTSYTSLLHVTSNFLLIEVKCVMYFALVYKEYNKITINFFVSPNINVRHFFCKGAKKFADKISLCLNCSF